MTRHIDSETLLAYALGEPTSTTSADIESHLAVCAACRRQEAELRQVVGAFADAEAGLPRAAILDSLLAAQRRQRDGGRRRAWQGGILAAGTVAAMLAVFAAGFWTGRRASPEVRTTEARTVVRTANGETPRQDLAAPQVMFVAAIPDRVAGLAKQDTTAN